MFDEGPINYVIFVNHPGVPEIPESIELVGSKERVELQADVVEDIQKGTVIIARGRKIDIDHWLSGVTLYVADTPSLTSWTKYTLPVRVKH
jgi:hypothetical protein